MQFIHSVNGEVWKPQKKSLKGDITQHHIDIQAPFNDFFCGFWSVAVNIMDALQFFIFIR